MFVRMALCSIPSRMLFQITTHLLCRIWLLLAHQGPKYLHLLDFQRQQECPLLDFLLGFHHRMV
uniref:Uncharacterized protein n=1 Tax=Arundo donax TaxID=35708 RepID=A0A0A9GV14_ARUDO